MTSPLTYFHTMMDYSISLDKIKFGLLMKFMHYLFINYAPSQMSMDCNTITAMSTLTLDFFKNYVLV